ncbi:MAG: GGDEF domain-containing protein [bacterium]|nr:GGDEF domain-containing protein [bacterium]
MAKVGRKSNKTIVVILIVVIVIVAALIFILNYSKDDYTLSFLEKKWIKDNGDKVIDVSIYNDVPIFGENGDGLSFELLDNFTQEYDIEFNKVPYFVNDASEVKDIAFRIIDYGTTVENNDILMYTDPYVLISKEKEKINNPSELKDAVIGVTGNDITNVSNYLYGASGTSYLPYSTFDEMLNAYHEDAINYMAIPKNLYLSTILENDDMYIVYHISEMQDKYVLTINNNDNFKGIITKYYNKFQNENYDDIYRKNYVDLFLTRRNIEESSKISYASKVYIYGYVENEPFENVKDEKLFGTLSNYINTFSTLVDVDFKFVKFDKVSDLKKAISNGEVDLAFGYFSTNGLNVDINDTLSLFPEKYVVLSNNDLIVNSIKSLDGENMASVSNTYLFDYLVSNNVKVKGYDDVASMLRSTNRFSNIVVDYGTYDYYKSNRLSDYNVVYIGEIQNDYKFYFRKVDANKVVSELFDFYMSTINYKDIEFDNKMTNSNKNNHVDFFKTLLIVLGVILVIVVIAIVLLRSKRKTKVIKKEEKMKFIDQMTSLKNRNYLNYNMAKWDKNVIYPQAIVIVDLNNIKYINDNYGHSKGDDVIKKAASILIVNQYENSDIIRTDGNEFLIYMVGYDERQVVSYIRKIYKELNELPYNFGASIGFSMIVDDIKTIDDAINEATLEMRSLKEKR